MSWSFYRKGTARRLKEEVAAHSAGLNGLCKTEFDQVAPAIVALCDANFDTRPGAAPVYLQVEGQGSGYTGPNGEYRDAALSVKRLGEILT